MTVLLDKLMAVGIIPIFTSFCIAVIESPSAEYK